MLEQRVDVTSRLVANRNQTFSASSDTFSCVKSSGLRSEKNKVLSRTRIITSMGKVFPLNLDGTCNKDNITIEYFRKVFEYFPSKFHFSCYRSPVLVDTPDVAGPVAINNKLRHNFIRLNCWTKLNSSLALNREVLINRIVNLRQ